MKKLFLLLTICSGIALFSFSKLDVDKSAATVNTVEGVYVFTDSKPTQAYDYLGTVNAMTMNGLYTEERSASIKQAKKKYPTVEGIIIHDDGKADAIKFK